MSMACFITSRKSKCHGVGKGLAIDLGTSFDLAKKCFQCALAWLEKDAIDDNTADAGSGGRKKKQNKKNKDTVFAYEDDLLERSQLGRPSHATRSSVSMQGEPSMSSSFAARAPSLDPHLLKKAAFSNLGHTYRQLGYDHGCVVEWSFN